MPTTLEITPTAEQIGDALGDAFAALALYPRQLAPLAHVLYVLATLRGDFHPIHADADEAFLALGLARREHTRGCDAVAYLGRDYDPRSGSYYVEPGAMDAILLGAPDAAALAAPDDEPDAFDVPACDPSDESE